jgi:hypothetical protein
MLLANPRYMHLKEGNDSHQVHVTGKVEYMHALETLLTRPTGLTLFFARHVISCHSTSHNCVGCMHMPQVLCLGGYDAVEQWHSHFVCLLVRK